MVTWQIVYTRQARNDAKKLSASNLRPNVEKLLSLIREDPFQRPHPYEKLVGDLSGAFSRRVNIRHRLVYQVLEEARVLKVIRMWTHYE
jgi:Txe/YoeB family toxin of toxin-antitoxin system